MAKILRKLSFYNSLRFKLLVKSVWVKHNSQSVPNSSWRQIFAESTDDSSVGSVAFGNSAPNDLERKTIYPSF